MATCVLLSILSVTGRGTLLAGRIMLMAGVAVLLLLLPWLWTPLALWQHHALLRLAGVVGAYFFTLALCQLKLTPLLRRRLLAVVVISALVQSAEAMIQAWLPTLAVRLMDFSGTSIYGIFQQRNLLASWLATGCGVALYLALTARSSIRALIWVIALYPLCIALVLSQSRAGGLGLIVVVILAALADLPWMCRRPLAVLSRITLLTSLLLVCSGISLWAMPSGQPADFNHEGSTLARLRLLEGTLQLIKAHPITGSGLGSFENQYPQALADAGLTSLESNSYTHPHNELLYVAAEGGLTAFAGLLLLATIWLWPFVYRVSYTVPASTKWLLPLTGLPVVIHMMVEYPLYLSAPHLMLLVLLFRIGLPEGVLRSVSLRPLIRMMLVPTSLLVIVVLILLVWGFHTQQVLTRAEKEMNSGLIPVLPASGWLTLTQQERLEYDRHMLAANMPGFGRDPQAMATFRVWGKQWLAVHNDAEVSATMIFIARQSGDISCAKKLSKLASRVFFKDERFQQVDE